MEAQAFGFGFRTFAPRNHYQRDIQPFEEGRYPKTLTIVSRDN